MLCIGLGVIINGLMFTLPRKQLREHADEALAQKALDLSLQAAGFPLTGLIPEAPTNALNASEQPLASLLPNTPPTN
jgi:hypothetical protein